jgi:hypothetical protein
MSLSTEVAPGVIIEWVTEAAQCLWVIRASEGLSSNGTADLENQVAGFRLDLSNATPTAAPSVVSQPTQVASITGAELQSGPYVNAAGATAVTPSAAGQVNFYFNNTSGDVEGHVYITSSGGWQAVQNLGHPNAGLYWDPDAASWGSGHVDLAVRDTNANLGLKTYDPVVGWGPWQTFSGTNLYSSPTAVSDAGGNLDLYWLGPN